MESNLVSMAQQFSGLPMESLIGAPLKAAANANSMMAMTQTKFMLDTCFSKEGAAPDVNYKPIMIAMSIDRPVIGAIDESTGLPAITSATTKFNLPLLTIIPLNSLAVETADVTFEMEVKSSFSEDESKTKETERAGEASFEAKCGWGPFSASIKGSASYSSKDAESHNTHYEKSNSAKYTVNVHAGQLPLPKGVNVIIEAFTKAIEPIEVTA